MNKQLDFNKIKDKLSKPISSKEALEEIVPIDFSKEVVEGKEKVIISELGNK